MLNAVQIADNLSYPVFQFVQIRLLKFFISLKFCRRFLILHLECLITTGIFSLMQKQIQELWQIQSCKLRHRIFLPRNCHLHTAHKSVIPHIIFRHTIFRLCFHTTRVIKERRKSHARSDQCKHCLPCLFRHIIRPPEIHRRLIHAKICCRLQTEIGQIIHRALTIRIASAKCHILISLFLTAAFEPESLDQFTRFFIIKSSGIHISPVKRIQIIINPAKRNARWNILTVHHLIGKRQ